MTGHSSRPQLQGKMVLMPKTAAGLDVLDETLPRHVTCQLVSSTVPNPKCHDRGALGEEEHVSMHWPKILAADFTFEVTFNWDVDKLGVPGAVIVKNNHDTEFFLKTLTIFDVPGHGSIVFLANSWVYNHDKYGYSRVFFTNDTYLPSQMPELLKPYREDELRILRGEDRPGAKKADEPYKEHDRVYSYDVYNDLGEPDRKQPRTTLGGPGKKQYPYPRRCRTGRKPTATDPACESRNVMLIIDQFYVPRDERFNHAKQADLLAYLAKSVSVGLFPVMRQQLDTVVVPREFNNLEDIYKLYEEGGLQVPDLPALDQLIFSFFPLSLLKNLMPATGDVLFKLPKPGVIKLPDAWRTDEEFAREMLAGLNPHIITRLTEFPPKSTLPKEKQVIDGKEIPGYGDQNSKITAEHIQHGLGKLTLEKALDGGKLFILDHHDNFMPHLKDINSLDNTFVYATRTLLLLQDDDTLKPLAIELSSPHLSDDGTKVVGAYSKVYTPPAGGGVEASIWQLAKAYAAVNDSAWHGLISHWLHTHAVIEPFVIATSRQLSVTHPVHKLLQPHYRDTMTVNALARQVLINAGGFFEMTVCPGKHALAMSSQVYANWNFTEQALPEDLVKRGVARPDATQPYKVELLIKDYPYAVDGLAVWSAIEDWADEYCRIYYPCDQALQGDTELQAWWKEVREVGHGDIGDKPWWPQMRTVEELVRSCATIVWIASALHAAVNFGQYSYAGFLPNRPTVSRRPMPEPGTKEYDQVERDPDMAFIHTITSQLQSIIGVSVIEVLSNHSSDEVYLGQRDTQEWTSDDRAKQAFRRFSERLVEIEGTIMTMNQDKDHLKNRNGPVEFPYMLLYPNTSNGDATGITAKGIPNSISI